MATYYMYDKATKVYIGSVSVKFNSPLVGFTTIEPLPPKQYYAVVYNESQKAWEYVPDYRGVWYNKKTKERVVIDKIGIKIDTTEYTQKVPCDYCIWDETKGDWVFSLDLYKQDAIKKVLTQYNEYIFTKEPVLRLLGFTSLIARIMVVLNTNKTLDESTVEKLASYINEADSVLAWITQVTQYEVFIEDQIRQASTKDDVDKVLASFDLTQFDENHPDVSLADKLIEFQKISLT